MCTFVTKGDICAISGHLCRFVDLETFVPNSSEDAAQNKFKERRILQVKLIRNLIFELLEFWGIYSSVIETVNDELKNICQVEHSRHRSVVNFLTNLIAGIIAYHFLPKKPSIKFETFKSNQLALY